MRAGEISLTGWIGSLQSVCFGDTLGVHREGARRSPSKRSMVLLPRIGELSARVVAEAPARAPDPRDSASAGGSRSRWILPRQCQARSRQGRAPEFLRPRAHVRLLAQPVDARQRPEV